jgi:hypothetical protein
MAPKIGMGNELQSYVIDGMIQGVSQQSAWSRRDTQCEAQFDCINSPVNGCEARSGFDWIKRLSADDRSNAFFYEIFRGDSEHYLVVIDQLALADGHKLHVYDMNTGLPCTVTYTAPETYLTCSANTPNISLIAKTLEDYTFIGNREVIPAMSTTNLSPAKKNAAILFFKAGGYSITFQVAVTIPAFTPDPAGISGKVYTWTYVTPDNSTTTNAQYISTNQLAATFFRSFTGVDAVVTTTGTSVSGVEAGVGPASTGHTTGTVTGGDTLTGLGFVVELNGNCIMMYRTDGVQFTVDSGDGVGDTYLHAIKDTVQNFSDLPASCFSGFTTKVIGSNQQANDDYYVQFKGADGSSGYWEEVVAPGTSLSFDPATVPLALVNTGVDTFELKYPPWAQRVSGDGIYNSLAPSFIGKPIWDIGFDHGRFTIMSEGSCVWSHPKNRFQFFPDSAQTVLDTDPIDLVPGGGSTIALLRRIVQAGETTLLWAEKIQFRATSGVNPFKQDTATLPPSTNYEFSWLATPKAVGQSLYFVTETGEFATVRDLSIQNGAPVGATDVTAHVKKYIPSGVRWITASDTLGILFCNSVAAPNQLYNYSYMLSATARLQSAWHTWRLPSTCKVLWTGMTLNYLYVVMQRADGAHLVRLDLSVDVLDSDAGATYRTRMDMRVPESSCTASYNAATNQTTITLPYAAPECVGWTEASTTPCPMLIGNRDSSGTRRRGHSWEILSFPTSTTVLVKGDCTGDHWYVGFRIRSERTQSRFYLKTNRGLVPTAAITVENMVVNYDTSGYFRSEINYQGRADNPAIEEMTAIVIGDTQTPIGDVPLPSGSFKIPIGSDTERYSLTLVNDSFLPSRWVSCSYEFKAAFRAVPSQYGQSVPSYFAQGGTAGYANNF